MLHTSQSGSTAAARFASGKLRLCAGWISAAPSSLLTSPQKVQPAQLTRPCCWRGFMRGKQVGHCCMARRHSRPCGAPFRYSVRLALRRGFRPSYGGWKVLTAASFACAHGYRPGRADLFQLWSLMPESRITRPHLAMSSAILVRICSLSPSTISRPSPAKRWRIAGSARIARDVVCTRSRMG